MDKMVKNDVMMENISTYPNGTYLKLKWKERSLILEGEIDTIYESENEFDEDDDNYLEYLACAFRIKKILKKSKNKKDNWIEVSVLKLEDKDYKINDLIEISILNQPSLIALEDGKIIWQKES